MSKIKELLIVTDEDVEEIRKHYKKTDADLKQDVGILKEWLRQEAHLPDDEDEGRLERMFLNNKCRLEQTKRKLDTCYSFKVFHPEMLDMYHINSEQIQNSMKSLIYVPLPKMTSKKERVFIYKIIDAVAFRGIESILYMLMMVELCNTFDYSLAYIVVVDWSSFSFNAMTTLDPNTLLKYGQISMNALSGRLANMQYLNAPTFMSYFLQIAKGSMIPKLFHRIKCTSTIEGVPKEILPVEYGGEEKSLDILHEEWVKELQQHADMLKKIGKRISNEKLRIGRMKKSDLFGTDGSFKQLNLD